MDLFIDLFIYLYNTCDYSKYLKVISQTFSSSHPNEIPATLSPSITIYRLVNQWFSPPMAFASPPTKELALARGARPGHMPPEVSYRLCQHLAGEILGNQALALGYLQCGAPQL